jgi:hypothetical protein
MTARLGGKDPGEQAVPARRTVERSVNPVSALCEVPINTVGAEVT